MKDTIERIRSATFTMTRRGYDRREVDTYLAKLADWLESGGDDQVQAETVKSEMERVGRRVSKELTAAEEASQGLRADAERESREITERARVQADSARATADEHAKQARDKAEEIARKTREEAEAQHAKVHREIEEYSTRIRDEADGYARRVRSEAESEVGAKLREAEEKAVRMVEEGAKRRREMETAVADLQTRRDSVLKGLETLSSQLAGAASEYKGEDDEAASGDQAPAGAGAPAGASSPRSSPQASPPAQTRQ